jgi:hypothetical protein
MINHKIILLSDQFSEKKFFYEFPVEAIDWLKN